MEIKWGSKKGLTIKRRDLHKKYGGQMQGGISTPSKYPFIFIFSNNSKDKYGYVDGFSEDGITTGGPGPYYLYTGEGTEGDQTFERGNKAIKEHVINKKKIYLFIPGKDEQGNRIVRCLNELRYLDYHLIQTPGVDGINRKAIQFILEKVGENEKSTSKNQTTVEYINREKNYKKPTTTERKGLVTSRVGQGWYRSKLIEKFKGACAVTKSRLEEVLVASHIVPWRESNENERLDPENGILLSPVYDALFDKHLISFDSKGKIIISTKLNKEKKILNLNENSTIELSDGMKKYLDRHRKQLR